MQTISTDRMQGGNAKSRKDQRQTNSKNGKHCGETWWSAQGTYWADNEVMSDS